MRVLAILATCFGFVSPLLSFDIFVNPELGDDAANGLAPAWKASDGPVKTIARGIALAGPGDTVHLVAGSSPYREHVGFYSKSGAPGKVITLNGNGVTIDGSEPLDATLWEEVSPGVFKSSRLYETVCHSNDAFKDRYYFIFNGEMNRMGRSLKGPAKEWKEVADLAEGEWTFVDSEKAFYIRVPAGKKLDGSWISIPVMTTGVQVTASSHLLIKNVKVTHVINDGFGITVGNNPDEKVRDLRFENIRAIDCGDDGLSAHGDCEVKVDGMISQGNSTGICSSGNGFYRNVVMSNNLGFDIYPYEGHHHFVDSVVKSSAAKSILVEHPPGDREGKVTLVMENCLIENSHEDAADRSIRIYKGGTFSATKVSIVGLGMVIQDAQVHFNYSLMKAESSDLLIRGDSVWKANHNHYALGRLIFGENRYNLSQFSDFVKATGMDTESVWGAESEVRQRDMNIEIGTDLSRLPQVPAYP